MPNQRTRQPRRKARVQAAAPQRVTKRTKEKPEAPLRWEIYGLSLATGNWAPLFQYRDPLYARAVLKILIDTEGELGQGLDGYEDFKIVPPFQEADTDIDP